MSGDRKAGLAAVVPAAGLSRRMGSEKVLLPFGRSTVLETILERLSTRNRRELHTWRQALRMPFLEESEGEP